MEQTPSGSGAVNALEVRGLTKAFAGAAALDSVDMTVAPGEIHALVGQNGSGKSTLIKVLAGYHKPDEGDVHIAGRPLSFGSATAARFAGCRFVHQDLGLIEQLSVLDNVFIGSGFPTRLGGIRRTQARREARKLLETVELDVDLSAPVGSLTRAQQTGVAVARVLRRDLSAPARLLVLDEPTATLPADEVELLIGIVRRVATTGVAVLYVSHRLDEVFALCDNVTALRDGRRMTTRPVATMTRGDLVQMVVGDELAAVDDTLAAVTHDVVGDGAGLVVEHLRSPHLTDVSFRARPGEIVGLAGITGSGRETVLGNVFGREAAWSGTVSLDSAPVRPGSPADAIAHGLGYMPPDRKVLGGMLDLTARSNVTISHLRPLWRRGWLSSRRERIETDGWFEKLHVRPADGADRPLTTFSGGNQQKILLAKWLRLSLKALLLDEPTQGVDVGAKAEIHRQLSDLAASGTALVISSSDVDELASLCTRVLIMRDGSVAATLSGDDVQSQVIAAECIRVEELASP